MDIRTYQVEKLAGAQATRSIAIGEKMADIPGDGSLPSRALLVSQDQLTGTTKWALLVIFKCDMSLPVGDCRRDLLSPSESAGCKSPGYGRVAFQVFRSFQKSSAKQVSFAYAPYSPVPPRYLLSNCSHFETRPWRFRMLCSLGLSKALCSMNCRIRA